MVDPSRILAAGDIHARLDEDRFRFAARNRLARARGRAGRVAFVAAPIARRERQCCHSQGSPEPKGLTRFSETTGNTAHDVASFVRQRVASHPFLRRNNMTAREAGQWDVFSPAAAATDCDVGDSRFHSYGWLPQRTSESTRFGARRRARSRAVLRTRARGSVRARAERGENGDGVPTTRRQGIRAGTRF
jgi:hypothetical protein